MKIWVADADVTAGLGAELRAAAEAAVRRKAPVFVPPGISALRLGEAANEAGYRDTLRYLLRIRHGISTEDFPVPRGSGPAGRAMQWLKARLWKLLKYQHQHITYQQNFINELIIHTLEFEVEARDRELQVLRQEIEALKRGERNA